MGKIKPAAVFQIGKNGVTDESISALNSLLKNHNQVRISVLKASGRDRESIKKIEDEIIQKIEFPCYSRIIGFTVVLSRKGSGGQK